MPLIYIAGLKTRFSMSGPWRYIDVAEFVYLYPTSDKVFINIIARTMLLNSHVWLVIGCLLLVEQVSRQNNSPHLGTHN